MEAVTSLQQIIDEAYAHQKAEASLKSGKLMALIAVPAILLFAIQDIQVLQLDATITIPWRIIGFLPCIFFLLFASRIFSQKSTNVTQLHAMDILGIEVMMAGLTFVIFTKADADTTLKFGVIAGYIVSIFGVFVLAGGARPLLKYLLPIPLLTALGALAILGKPQPIDWVFLTNLILAAGIAIVLSNRQTRLEKLEFTERKKLEISEKDLTQEVGRRRIAEQELLKHQEHLESEVAKRTEELAIAKQDAEQMNYLKGIMLSSISHELVTPLNHITAAAELLTFETDPELIAEDAQILKESGTHLARTLNGIVSFSHLEANMVELNPLPVIVGETIKDEVDYFKELAAKKDLSFQVNIPEEEKPVNIDKQILKQIVFCLVDNAIKFTEKGEIQVDYQLNGTNGLDNEIILKVSDTGIGIKEQFIQDLFSPFRQESEGISRNFDGMGLGLALVSGYVNLLNGKVNVHSEKGKGSTFTINIPVTA